MHVCWLFFLSSCQMSIVDESFFVTNLGAYLDNRTLCRLSCAERLPRDSSFPQRQQRKEDQPLTLRLRGRAECHVDCEGVALLLQFSDTAPFLGECYWDDDVETPFEELLHIEFHCSRRNLSSLQRAVKTFLQDLRQIDDFRVLRETLTFSDEFTGVRLNDNGEHHQADIYCRLVDKVTRSQA